RLLESGLREEGCSVIVAGDGASAVEQMRHSVFDVLVLDVMLPRLDGFSVARILRREEYQTPILFLTARDRTIDIVNGLNLGADDYLTKPFSFEVLVARVRALARRVSTNPPQAWRIGGLYINSDTREVRRHGK